jgi:hypothetical protein
VHDVGAFNLHQFGAYEILEHAGTPADRQWLILAPPEFALPVYRWQEEALAFFDHIAHDADNGYAEQSRVRYLTNGSDENDYRGATTFPIPGASKVRYYLDSAGEDQAVHSLITAAPANGANSWAATPFGAIVPPGMDEVANPILTYQVQVTEETELIGPVTASLVFSCTEIDSHVIARVCRVDLDGELHILSMGSIRPVYRHIDEDRSFTTEIVHDLDQAHPLVPGREVTLRFSLTPFPVLLRRGESLRVDLGSRTDLLRSDVAHGYEHFEMMVPPYFSRNTVHYGKDTYLEFDRVDR